MRLVYASLTGNSRSFVNKLLETNKSIETLEIKSGEEVVEGEYLLLTYTTGQGQTPPKVEKFLIINGRGLLGVIGSGNKNWGSNYCKGALRVAYKYGVPCYHTFQMRGSVEDVQKVSDIIDEMKKENDIRNG